jgi:hydroxymethylpyrimidine pyrophosphatase-like HAD family hydrolase
MGKWQGHKGTPEYTAWQNMLTRSRNPNRQESYVAKGISADPAWHVFTNFLADMGPRPSSLHSLERKDNSLGYNKANCKWALRLEQNRNRDYNVKPEYKGRTYLSLTELAEHVGVGYNTLRSRLRYGWSIEAAIEKPARKIVAKGLGPQYTRRTLGMTTEAPTNERIIEQYLADQAKVRAIKAKAEELIAPIEQFQANREAYLLKQSDPAIVDFMTNLYLNGRDGKASAEAKKKDLGLKQGEIEKWLLTMLDKLKSKGIKTEFGTVYPTRKEAVSVEDWDAFLEAEILTPAAVGVCAELDMLGMDGTPLPGMMDKIISVFRSAAHLEFINKGVNKTSVLERMGDKNEKDDSRPNPAPAGVKYTAMRTVGVRKS